MAEPGFLPLVHNAALLLAIALVCDVALTRRRVDPSRLPQVPVGLVLGGIGVAVMLSSWPLDRGIVLDSRSILLAVSGLYFGTIPTVVAMAVTAAFRLWMGGAVGTGVSVIVASGASVSSGAISAGRGSPTRGGPSCTRSASRSTWRCSR